MNGARSSTVAVPRVVLLTLWPPDAKYKILARYAGEYPADRFMWVSLQAAGEDQNLPFRHVAFVPNRLHWRLQSGALGWWFAHEAQAARLSRQIAAWAGDFRPDVLWVLSELGAAGVALRLRKRLKIPMHVTSHDAHETGRDLVPPLFYAVHRRTLEKVVAGAASLDAVSAALITHHARKHGNLTRMNTLVFPPSMDKLFMVVPPDVSPGGMHRVVRIGLCGSMRVTSVQWGRFLTLLAGLPFGFEIVTFAYADMFPAVATPANVLIERRSFAATESALIEELHRAKVEACYLGLFKEEDRRLFCRTSLSAKLTTYLAAGLPVIVDGPVDSAAWELMRPYDAGVLFDNDTDLAVSELTELFSNPDVWQRKAAGAQRLCREQFDLGRNMEKFRELLGKTAAKKVNSEQLE